MIGLELILAGLLTTASLAPADVETRPTRITNTRGVAIIFTPPRDNIEAYISSRHAVLNRLAAEFPSQRFEAQLSFTAHLTGEQLLRELRKSSTTIVSLDFGWNGQNGGFDLRDGESLVNGLERLHHQHSQFITQMEESNALIDDETQRDGHRPEDKERFQRHIEHVKALSTAFRKHGVLFIGATARATPANLQILRDRSEYVRLVDPLWDELSDMPGATKVHKISIPLEP